MLRITSICNKFYVMSARTSSKPPERPRDSVASIYSAKETHTVALYAGS